MAKTLDWTGELPAHEDQTAWLALDYLNIYRLFVAMLYTGLYFTPVMLGAYASATLYAAKAVTLVFLVVSPVLFVLARRLRRHIAAQAAVGLLFDLVFNLVMLRLMGGIGSGVGALLVGSMGAAGAIFLTRMALVYAAVASIAVLWQAVVDVATGVQPVSVIVPNGLLGATLFATTMLGAYLARRARESQSMLRLRSEDVANLAALNEMIIERMRTGVLIVDPKDNTHVMNDSAWYLLGMPASRNGKLTEVAPELTGPLASWRAGEGPKPQPVKLKPGSPPVVPRFARLGVREPSDTLVFLEDISLVSQRAQELTLSSLGRLSASIAHEIRNPLAAISHSAQLLAESESMDAPDRRLTEIIGRHCTRMNDIIENVLQLARQAPARPEPVALNDWVTAFCAEFKRLHGVGRHSLETEVAAREIRVTVDPVQLQQVIWNLCQNAIKYGRGPDGDARIRVRTGFVSGDSGPYIEVADRGTGIAESHREQIFEPFFTSSSDGTGLGLYLCQQLCTANQANLEYRARRGGGSAFRVLLTASSEQESGQELDSRPVS